MNSTMQQLFWSFPFRTAVLSAPPPVADAPEQVTPLPKAVAPGTTTGATSVPTSNFCGISADSEEDDDSPEPTKLDVGWEVQKMFSYMQDCQLGQYSTDHLVRSCKIL